MWGYQGYPIFMMPPNNNPPNSPPPTGNPTMDKLMEKAIRQAMKKPKEEKKKPKLKDKTFSWLEMFLLVSVASFFAMPLMAWVQLQILHNLATVTAPFR